MIMLTDRHPRSATLFRYIAFLGLTALVLCGSAGHARAAGTRSNTRIVSEKMIYDAKNNKVIFEGSVHVTRPTMEIWSEMLTVILDDSGKKTETSPNAIGVGGGKVERIVAERNVRIKQDTKLGTSGKATYFVNEGRIVMEQSPVIVDGHNRISGKSITYYTETGRSVVVGDTNQKVEVNFTVDEKKSPTLPGVGVPEPAPEASAPGNNGALQ